MFLMSFNLKSLLKLPIVFRFVMFSAVSVVCGATALINENLKIWFGLAHSDDVFTDMTAHRK